MQAHTDTCTHTRAYIYMCMHIHTHVYYARVHISAHAYVCTCNMCVHMSACTCKYTYAHTGTCTCACTYAHARRGAQGTGVTPRPSMLYSHPSARPGRAACWDVPDGQWRPVFPQKPNTGHRAGPTCSSSKCQAGTKGLPMSTWESPCEGPRGSRANQMQSSEAVHNTAEAVPPPKPPPIHQRRSSAAFLMLTSHDRAQRRVPGPRARVPSIRPRSRPGMGPSRALMDVQDAAGSSGPGCPRGARRPPPALEGAAGPALGP